MQFTAVRHIATQSDVIQHNTEAELSHAGWSDGQSVGRLVGRLVSRSVGRSVGRSVHFTSACERFNQSCHKFEDEWETAWPGSFLFPLRTFRHPAAVCMFWRGSAGDPGGSAGDPRGILGGSAWVSGDPPCSRKRGAHVLGGSVRGN